jgi:hypothetical protein
VSFVVRSKCILVAAAMMSAIRALAATADEIASRHKQAGQAGEHDGGPQIILSVPSGNETPIPVSAMQPGCLARVFSAARHVTSGAERM